MQIDALMADLAMRRPVFHSEADFQQALVWHIQQQHPDAVIRLEASPRRGVRLDLLVRLRGRGVAIELKHFVAAFNGVVAGERFELRIRTPMTSAGTT
jgi:hypothetical protein